MLINNTAYLVVAISVAVLAGAPIAWAAWRKWGKRGPLIGILASVLVWVGSQSIAGRCYILDDTNTVYDYRSFGSVDYTFHNGKKIFFSGEWSKVTVINDSPEPVVLEELIYSSSNSTPEGEIFSIGPFSSGVYFLPYRCIDYFPNERIPDQIEEGGSSDVSKYWLHRE